MSSKYQIGDERYAHFVTFTVVNWIDLFTRDVYRDILIESSSLAPVFSEAGLVSIFQ
jgi:hypothetical protein